MKNGKGFTRGIYPTLLFLPKTKSGTDETKYIIITTMTQSVHRTGTFKQFMGI